MINAIEDILAPLVTVYLAAQTGQIGQMAVPLMSGVIKGMMKQGVTKMTGSASDSVLTRIVQDFLGGRGVDELMRRPVKRVDDVYKNYKND